MSREKRREENRQKLNEVLEDGFADLYDGAPIHDVILEDILSFMGKVKEADDVCAELDFKEGFIEGKDKEIYKWADDFANLCHTLCELIVLHRHKLEKFL